MTSPPTGSTLVTTVDLIARAVAGDRPGLRDALTRALADGEAGQRMFDDAFAELVTRPSAGKPADHPVFLLTECCPHPGRTRLGNCTVCSTQMSASAVEANHA